MALSKELFIIMCLLMIFAVVFGLIGAAFGQSDSAESSDSGSVEKDHGIIGGFFHFFGEVVAFPFRVVGGAIDAIF